MAIPVIDLFAGPGGLGEGFSSFSRLNRWGEVERPFEIRLSVEKDPIAHLTLELRAFFRQFPSGEAPDLYYSYLRGEVSRQLLFDSHPEEAQAAAREAWQTTLGQEAHGNVMERIRASMRLDCRRWVLIGGPPCQAYSLAGRSRMRNLAAFATDHRHFLYREYLRIIADRMPAVFVMENVQGMLSSRTQQAPDAPDPDGQGERIFGRILNDLQHPRAALALPDADELRYHVFPLGGALQGGTDGPGGQGVLFHQPDPREFLVRTERFGIPQARPRVFLLGVREDVLAQLRHQPARLTPHEGGPVTLWDVIGNLPPLRSRFSRGETLPADWRDHIVAMTQQAWFTRLGVVPFALQMRLCERAAQLELMPDDALPNTGGNWVPCDDQLQFEQDEFNDWYHDPRLQGVCNHESRGHMRADLWRYFYAATFVEEMGRSPVLRDFPAELRPDHENVGAALRGNDLFSDRFRVQLRHRPSTTVVSHISKDGHYYIHPDPLQCRSLTVREAARLQTFPDNYFFEGPRTAQYHQVGNAVPPLLAHRIAAVVRQILPT